MNWKPWKSFVNALRKKMQADSTNFKERSKRKKEG
jgi:hypothetical protein